MSEENQKELIIKYLGVLTPDWIVNNCLKLLIEYDKIKNCDHDWVKVTVHEYEEDKLNYKCSKCYDFKTEEK